MTYPSNKSRGRSGITKKKKYAAITEPEPLVKEESTILMPQWLLELKQRQDARFLLEKGHPNPSCFLEETPVHTFSGQSPPVIVATHSTLTTPANVSQEKPSKKSKKRKTRKMKRQGKSAATFDQPGLSKGQTTVKETVELVRVPSKLQMMGRSEEDKDYDLELIQMPRWLLTMAKRVHEEPPSSSNPAKHQSPKGHYAPTPLSQPVILASSLEPPRPMARAYSSPPIVISHGRSSAPRYPVAPRNQIEQRVELVRVPSAIENLKPQEEDPLSAAINAGQCCGSPDQDTSHVRSPLALLRKFQQLLSPSSQSPQPLTVLTQNGNRVTIFQDPENLPRNSQSVPVVARPNVHHMWKTSPLADVDDDGVSSLSSDDDDNDEEEDFLDVENPYLNSIPQRHSRRSKKPTSRVLGDITPRMNNQGSVSPPDEQQLIKAHYAKWRSRHGQKNMQWSRNLRQHSTPDEQVYVFQ